MVDLRGRNNWIAA